MQKLLSGNDGKEIKTALKHLIIFLNYNQSRLDNPVYRIFSTETLNRKNTALLFLPKPLEERDLLHEVSELVKRPPGTKDITFHICSNLMREAEGDCVVQTISLIRRLFMPDLQNKFPTFVYGQIPSLTNADAEAKRIVWKNLVSINNAVADFIECRLLSTVYLYSDATQNSLAEFIHIICHSEVPFEKLSTRLPIKQGELFGENIAPNIDFPPIFGGFNSIGMRYPEDETRIHLRQFYIYSVLKNALHDANETRAEECNNEAQRILSNVPIETSRICLQEDSFINLNSDENIKWQTPEKFWKDNVEQITKGLSEYPRDDWFPKIMQRAEVLLHSNFREIGIDYFFKLEDKRSEGYCSVLSMIIKQEFENSVKNNTFSIEAHKTIVRALINILQTKVIEIQKLKTDSEAEINSIQQEITLITDKWTGLSFFSRMRGKDNDIMTEYRNAIVRLMTLKCTIPGCVFATKLLNELIPNVSALLERCEIAQRNVCEAMQSLETMVNESNPSELYGIFGDKELVQAKSAIETDTESLHSNYKKIMCCVYGDTPIDGGNELLIKLRYDLGGTVYDYLDNRIEDCSLPPILGMSIVERIARHTSATGGIGGFIEGLKHKINIAIKTKKTCPVESKYILIAPQMDGQIGQSEQSLSADIEHLQSEDITQIQLLNVKYGLTLQDLEGFAGQRMFVEPSIF